MIKNFNGFINERFTHDNLKNVILLTYELVNNSGMFLLYDVVNNSAIGYIQFCYVVNGDIFTSGIYSKNGYGPLLYEIVMTWVYPKGLAPSQDSGTSDDANVVWDKFKKRDDVKKTHIERNGMSDKEEDLIDGCGGDEECLKQVKKIIDLHNIRFTYTFGISFLNKMIEKGEIYKIKNNLSSSTIYKMCIDLEN